MTINRFLDLVLIIGTLAGLLAVGAIMVSAQQNDGADDGSDDGPTGAACRNPGQPDPPSLSYSNGSLNISWDAVQPPQPNGAISYDLQYKLASETNWSWKITGGTSTSVAVPPGTYHARVRAVFFDFDGNECDGPWSGTGIKKIVDLFPVLPSNIGPYSRQGPGEIVAFLPAATGGNAPLTYGVAIYAIDYTNATFNRATRRLAFTIPTAPRDIRVYYQVTDADGDKDDVDIRFRTTLLNQAPNADAGADQTAEVGDSVTLDGSGSSDPDGDSLRYRWHVLSTNGTYLAVSSNEVYTSTAPSDSVGTYTYRLTVRDPGGLSDTDSVQVTINDPPDPVVRPSAPTWSGTSHASTTSITPRWNAATSGDNAIDGYDLRYRVDGTTTWTEQSNVSTRSLGGDIATTVSGLPSSTTYQMQVRAFDTAGHSGDWSGTKYFNTVTPRPATPTPPTPTPTPTPPATLEPPGAFSYQHFSQRKVHLDQTDARLFLDWDDVPGADSYVVQIKDLVYGPYSWTDLPSDLYYLEGATFVRESQAMIGGLYFSHEYQIRLMSVRGDDERSDATPGVRITTAPPFYGRQKDHTVQYDLGSLTATLSPTDPRSYDPESILRAAITEGISDWNNSPVGNGTPNLLICELDATCPASGPNDGRVVTVQVTNEPSTCLNGIACFDPTLTHVTDRDGYVYGGNIYMEEPARGAGGLGRYLWTDDPTLQGVPVSEGTYRWWEYAPDTVMHEFGHTFGLYDFYRTEVLDLAFAKLYWYRGLRNSVMWSDASVAHEFLPNDDVTYIGWVYHNHIAR